MMNRISLIDFAKKQAIEPLLEKEVQVRALLTFGVLDDQGRKYPPRHPNYGCPTLLLPLLC
jgi:hypothetical protein